MHIFGHRHDARSHFRDADELLKETQGRLTESATVLDKFDFERSLDDAVNQDYRGALYHHMENMQQGVRTANHNLLSVSGLKLAQQPVGDGAEEIARSAHSAHERVADYREAWLSAANDQFVGKPLLREAKSKWVPEALEGVRGARAAIEPLVANETLVAKQVQRAAMIRTTAITGAALVVAGGLAAAAYAAHN